MSTYFIVLLCSLSIPLISSFHPRMPFVNYWRFFFPAVLLSASVFILWDIYFTRIGIWGFNPMHLQGWFLGGLPLEECLFFIVIPYACMFSYEVLPLFVNPEWINPYIRKITYSLIVLCLLCVILFYDKLYPATTFSLLGALLLIHFLWIKSDYLGKFLFTYFVVALPFLIVNGILTGSFIEEEVVWYNSKEIIGLRLGTIPFEDYFYGMLLMLFTCTIYEKFKKYF